MQGGEPEYSPFILPFLQGGESEEGRGWQPGDLYQGRTRAQPTNPHIQTHQR